MKITDYIRGWFRKQDTNVLREDGLQILGGWCPEERMPFADVLFLNICDLLTDISAEVIWERRAGNIVTFAAFRAFYDVWAKLVLNTLFSEGFIVIGYKGGDFRIMKAAEYVQVNDNDITKVVALDEDTTCYVMRSQTYILTGKSDKQILRPWLRYLDNVMNSSNTVSARLGSMVIMSPQQVPQAPTVTPLSKEHRQELEKEIAKNYGSLSRQSQLLMLTRPMSAQVVNMAGLDQKTQEKTKLAILAIVDRIKVPANQVAIIDATSNKSLSNGTELREGDLSKYRSFRRLLNMTFYQMAEDFGLQVDYTIENEPKTVQGQEIEQ